MAPKARDKKVPPTIKRGLRLWAENLSDWRRLSGLTQAQLADRSGISRSTLIRLEQGDGGVSLENLLRVLRALGIFELLSKALDPYESDLGRLRSDEKLRERIRPQRLTGQDDG
jgi:transcriptional regulator with XRE-family HTH domain